MKYRGFNIQLYPGFAEAAIWEDGEDKTYIKQVPGDSLINAAKSHIDFLYDSNVEVTDDHNT